MWSHAPVPLALDKANSCSTAMLRMRNASYESNLFGNFEGTFIVACADTSICALPSCPRLVVIKITPFAPFTP